MRGAMRKFEISFRRYIVGICECGRDVSVKDLDHCWQCVSMRNRLAIIFLFVVQEALWGPLFHRGSLYFTWSLAFLSRG